jgi:arsenite transporter
MQIWKWIGILQRNLVWSIPAFMILGVSYGVLVDAANLKALIIPFTFLMVYPMMVTLNIREVFHGGDARLQITAQLINFVLIPLLGFVLGKIFFADRPMIALGLLLTALLPTSGMTISWTGFAKGNIPAAIKMTVIGLLLGSLATPFYLKGMMGAVVSIPLADVFRQIVLIVFLPMAAGYATRRFLLNKYGAQRFQKEFKPRFPALSTLGVLGIVFIAMALKARSIVADPAALLVLLLPLALIYAANFGLSTLVGRLFFGRNDAIALVYGTVMRNLSIALAIAMTAFGEAGAEIALIIALAYIIQVQAAAWYVKFTDRLFGAPAAPTTAPLPSGD